MNEPQYAIEQMDPADCSWHVVFLCAEWQDANEQIERLKKETGYRLRIAKLGATP